VGVVKDFNLNTPREKIRPVYFRPLVQQYAGFVEPPIVGTEVRGMFANSILLRFNRPQEDVESIVRRTLNSINPNLTVIDLRSLDDQVAGNFNQDRLIARVTTLFGVLALILATVGLYGVTSYFVARRTSEIGIRMALGSTRSGVVALVLRSVVVQIGLGLLLGVPAAMFAGHFMASELYGVGQFDPTALIAATGVLAACAIVAGFIPARRAASIEPMQALRTE
jgi:ABC-type antimicrobial peptide transport system permease subunit